MNLGPALSKDPQIAAGDHLQNPFSMSEKVSSLSCFLSISHRFPPNVSNLDIFLTFLVWPLRGSTYRLIYSSLPSFLPFCLPSFLVLPYPSFSSFFFLLYSPSSSLHVHTHLGRYSLPHGHKSPISICLAKPVCNYLYFLLSQLIIPVDIISFVILE